MSLETLPAPLVAALVEVQDAGDPIHGYLYVIQCQDDYFKIGIARNVNTRLANLQGASPFELKLIYTRPCSHPSKVERRLHIALIQYWVRGEWFNLNAPPREELTPTNIRKGGRRPLIGVALEGKAAELAKQFPRSVAARMLGVSTTTLSRYVECTPMPGASPRERAIANLARAKEWGSVVGRKHKLDAGSIERGRQLLKEKPLAEVAKELGVSEATVRRRVMKS